MDSTGTKKEKKGKKGRPRIGTGKINHGEALRLSLLGVSQSEIARQMGVAKQSISKCLARYYKLLREVGNIDAYRANRADLLTAAESALLSDVVDKRRRAKATLANAAYALDKVATHGRLERGQSTANIAVALSDDDRLALKRIAREVAASACSRVEEPD